MRLSFCRMFAVVLSCFLLLSSGCYDRAQARKSRHAGAVHHTSHGGKSHAQARGRSSHNSSRHSRSAGRHSQVLSHGRHHSHSHSHVAHHSQGHTAKHHASAHVAHAKPKYAYPLGLFMAHAPAFDRSFLEPEQASQVARQFEKGLAHGYPARTLVRAGVFKYHPLRGGIFYRREPVKYIVMHSTETGIPVPGKNVIESWSSMGLRHPGAQYVVDRDGTIYQALDPDLACVHVNIFKTLPGINNDNSIGIEMNHTGSQDYPYAQRQAVIQLVGYLQRRYDIQSGNIITHRYAQQGDHTDPVNFNFDEFLATVDNFKTQAIAYRVKNIKEDARFWKRSAEPEANTYLKPHQQLGKPEPAGEETDLSAAPVVPASGSAVVSPAVSSPANLPLTKPELKPAVKPEIIPIPLDGNGNPIENGKDMVKNQEPGLEESNLKNPPEGGLSQERRDMWLRPYPGLK